MTGRVYLVGAGCSDSELMTIRGSRLLSKADVVVYDDLIDQSILDMAGTSRLIYVGKRGGCKSSAQEDINEILIREAKAGNVVVRLKGGDPFVFGRGGEEFIALSKAEIPCSVVPGISSGIAIPMEAGIPVTHRGVARSMHFITGHTKEADNPIPEDIPALSRLHGTLVFFMGISHLDTIANALIENGKPSDTPAAVVQGGNAGATKSVRGNLSNIAEKTRKAGIGSPALIVVGDVAEFEFLDKKALPLSGVTVGITGTESFCNNLRPLLWDAGARVKTVQKATCKTLFNNIAGDFIPKGEAVIAFLSANGVRSFFELMHKNEVDIRCLYDKKFAVIGEATGKILRNYGIIPDITPKTYTKEALTESLLTLDNTIPIYIYDSLKGNEYIVNELNKNGNDAKRISIYDTIYHPVTDAECDYILFGSAGAVKAFHGEGIPTEAIPVCIGPVAAKSYKELYDIEPIVPEKITTESMVELIISTYQRQNT